MDCQFLADKANAVLELDRKIVGIKLVYTADEFACAQAKALKYPVAYCVAVKLAMGGLALKMTMETSRCGGSTRALGLAPPPDSFYSGQDGCALGLYGTRETASSVAAGMAFCPPRTYGVIIKPLEQFAGEPDIVLLVGSSYTVMRVIQGHSYMFGMQPNFNMLGNQAICVECTSYPLMTGRINVSMLCSGTRFLAKWRDTDVAVGIPYQKFGDVVEGVRLTVNAVETDSRKKLIQSKLERLGYDPSDIIFNDTYYLRLERNKKNIRKEG